MPWQNCHSKLILLQLLPVAAITAATELLDYIGYVYIVLLWQYFFASCSHGPQPVITSKPMLCR
jgi:hypothetical protein